MKKERKIKEEKEKKTENFNIVVTYDKNGKSFQSIAEDILIRKMNEI